VPKIIQIGKCMLKLQLKCRGCFFWVTVYSDFACRQADLLGVDRESGSEDGFIERYRTSYTAERVQGVVHRHHSLQRLSLHLRPQKTVCKFHCVSNSHNLHSTSHWLIVSHYRWCFASSFLSRSCT